MVNLMKQQNKTEARIVISSKKSVVVGEDEISLMMKSFKMQRTTTAVNDADVDMRKGSTKGNMRLCNAI